jgi:PhnB protein
MGVNFIPEGYRTITPYLNLERCKAFLEFAKKAFSAEVKSVFEMPDGQIGHAVLRIGDSLFMVSDAMNRQPKPAALWLYVKDADAAFKQAVTAGAKVIQPMTDQFWGDRHGMVEDAFGNSWSIATHKEDLKPDELQKRAIKAMAETPRH